MKQYLQDNRLDENKNKQFDFDTYNDIGIKYILYIFHYRPSFIIYIKEYLNINFIRTWNRF